MKSEQTIEVQSAAAAVRTIYEGLSNELRSGKSRRMESGQGGDGKPLKGPQIERLKVLARKVRDAQVSLGDRFFKLCAYIRKEQLHPETTRNALKAAGLHAARISEIFKVANASPEIFNDYKRRLIGFKLALSQARAVEHQGEAAEIAVWHRWFAQFDRLSIEKLPPSRIHDLNGTALAVWKHEEVGEKKFTFDQDNWRVTVERKMKPKTRQKKKAKPDEKSGTDSSN